MGDDQPIPSLFSRLVADLERCPCAAPPNIGEVALFGIGGQHLKVTGKTSAYIEGVLVGAGGEIGRKERHLIIAQIRVRWRPGAPPRLRYPGCCLTRIQLWLGEAF